MNIQGSPKFFKMERVQPKQADTPVLVQISLKHKPNLFIFPYDPESMDVVFKGKDKVYVQAIIDGSRFRVLRRTIDKGW